ncbi:MAG: energy-coupling factor transporter transmembrane protein EcfT [Deltaproteobacteria bacterium]|nr:energy-coupling factor transporter transmembrane protein EcfT [Deltaproteobacteria bacterium]
MRIGQYIPCESLIHRLDPRVKIGSTVALSVLILRGSTFTEVLISAFVVALIPLSRLSVNHMAQALRPVFFFFALLFCLHLLFTDGTPIPPFPPWPVTVTYEGLYRGVMTTWQFVLLILSASILTMTTWPTEMVNGIEKLLRPLKALGVPSHDLAVMISVALRFVPTFLEEIERIKTAQMARGANFRSGPFVTRIRTLISLLLPLVLRAFHKADNLVTAMEARGYKRGPRTYMKELRMTRADYGAVLVIVGMTCLHVVGEVVK